MKIKMYQDLSKYKFHLDRGRTKFFIVWYNLCYAILIRPTPKFFYGWRRWMYRLFGAKIGHKVRIAPSVRILYPWKITIGDYSWIGDGSNLYSVDNITIGNHVVISFHVFLSTAAHDISDVHFSTISNPIIIRDEVWLASNVVVNQGITIGKGSVVGDCSLVTKSLPEGIVAMGIPAKVIKQRTTKSNQKY